MNIWGKVFLGFVVIGGIAAFVLSGKLLDIRTGWQKKLKEIETQTAKSEAAAVEAEEKLQKLEAEIAQIQQESGRSWVAQGTILDPATGRITLDGLGTSVQNPFGVPKSPTGQLPTAHLFVLEQDVPRYLGEFQATNIAERQTQMRPVEPPLSNQNDPPQSFDWQSTLTVEGWPQGRRQYLIRETVPPRYANNFPLMLQRMGYEEEEFIKQQRNRESQQASLEKVRKLRDFRIAELLGDSYLPHNERLREEDRPYQQELALGYIKSVQQADTERNVVLSEVDALRREVKSLNDDINALFEENKELAKQLPGAE